MRLDTRTSCQSTPSSCEHSVKLSETSANPRGLRDSAPLKMPSAISPPRSDLADCSPKTQRTASQTLDLPQPLGPTMAVTPSWKWKIVLSAKDLKPKSSSDWRCIDGDTALLVVVNIIARISLQGKSIQLSVADRTLTTRCCGWDWEKRL